MAKGLEDTAFFVHHGLISLNEVGCNPLRKEIRFGVAAFHQYNKKSSVEHPFTLNATSTHDTKWSEDVRARINVLSEIPGEWKTRLLRWTESNQKKKTVIDGRAAPSPNEEVLLYQSMLGIWPLERIGSEPDRRDLQSRVERFMLKAAREAKTHSSWASPNEAHEGAIKSFIAAIFECSPENSFLRDFMEFSESIALYGACNALSQVLLKITSPGVPDFFQGNELWNFRLTDPDNRHEVDFAKRRELLNEAGASGQGAFAREGASLLESWRDGRVKMFLTKEALNFRLANRDLFLRGEYLPLASRGGASRVRVRFRKKARRRVGGGSGATAGNAACREGYGVSSRAMRRGVRARNWFYQRRRPQVGRMPLLATFLKPAAAGRRSGLCSEKFSLNCPLRCSCRAEASSA